MNYKELSWLVQIHSSLSVFGRHFNYRQLKLDKFLLRQKEIAGLLLASILELGFLSTTGMWNYYFKPSGLTFIISATNLLHTKSHLINNRIRPIHLALWLIHVSFSVALSRTDCAATRYLDGFQDAVGMDRVLLDTQTLCLTACIASHCCFLPHSCSLHVM